ncbi:O-acetylhomoserine aminocarboxypropyltransferase/cysteine synthase family protein [Alloalcanivorax xenomutans]|jgi:O-acetylhomoserine (thiol)-lyase|uniref:Aminotransferase class I/II-fold pyridoxal phosphate-dependent enzyme n=1 Tax=Alloalcanivorax xenomutans TaxID=1094342 RepID=A0A9Q3W3V2_9GAMM|nr:aminotransferase class I/II-fold pyridoxal phosphate-dependent enzyme [Alloalcanivorax xenomutans]KYZ85576.1 O-acetylhomoserine aminocarboxypropyltransferase [Alcanivorax sp. KX64203]MBA4719881.1 aminotransferase class I/II-fold pyridoxal phosphate-dependent enzyme [Alcanivorax sp.]MCE7508009.1 aminotransferase class I/II-fold pyridoxal phosphate-dependent enzyme [Alloalcanivorax xenomutans]MCE7523264.1 aminotransferase class I/II-fold pyridoxal phosphate-dependent enzyme [Alloalcanivorax xe
MKRETIAIHGGFAGDPETHSVAVPIYQTTSYYFDNTQHGADLFDLKVPGNIYSRIMNPTNGVLEERVAQLEGGIGALAMASGMAAITAAVQTLARAGDNIVSVSQLYGGTYNLFAHTLPTMGIEVRMADGRDVQAMAAAIDDNTKAVFCESIGNPAGNIVDLAALAKVAHDAGVPLIVDNTVASPALCRPFEHGADIVVHSLTKYMGGHGTTVGGIIVDSGNFPWQGNARFPQFNEPDPSYHGVIYTEAMGPAAFIARARVVPLRNMGAALSPMNAFLILQGIETLNLRMERHCENAIKVARYLKAHDKVEWVNYAGLEGDRDAELAKRYMDGGLPSAILSFGIKGGREAGARFIDALQMIKRLVNIGDAKSLACHPATTTHRQLNDDELKTAGVSADLVRLSIGIEHVDDILADIEQALDAV